MASRTSKYEQYKPEIIQCRLSGMSISQIAERLSDRIDADEQGINYFCQSRKIPTLITQGLHGIKREMIPICNGCEDCYEVTNIKGDGNDRICGKSNRRVGKTCLTSPMWCERRESIYEQCR